MRKGHALALFIFGTEVQTSGAAAGWVRTRHRPACQRQIFIVLHPMEFRSSTILEVREPDQLAKTLLDTDTRYLRLSAEPYVARLTSINLGSLRFTSVDDSAHASHGPIDRDCVVLLYGVSTLPEDIRINGTAMATSQAILLGPGSPLECRVPSKIHWASLSFDAGAFQQAIGEEAMPRDGEFRFVNFDRIGRARLTELTTEIAAIAAVDPGRLELPQVQKQIAGTCLRLAILPSRSGKERWLRVLHHRVRIVANAEEFIATRLGVALYTTDICAALGVAGRTLYEAFVAVHGMSPHKYLHLRRLNHARDVLRSGQAAQVKAAALGAGFWNLGRFSQAYRELFGEFPSQTLTQHRIPGLVKGDCSNDSRASRLD